MTASTSASAPGVHLLDPAARTAGLEFRRPINIGRNCVDRRQRHPSASVMTQ